SLLGPKIMIRLLPAIIAVSFCATLPPPRASPPEPRVLHLEPIGGAPRTVDGILALRDDAFEAKLAGVGEDGRAVTLHVFVQPQCRGGPWLVAATDPKR